MASYSQPMAGTQARARTEPSGWIVFAAVILIMTGALDGLWGLAAILNDKVVTVGGAGVIAWDFTAWGWIHLILGGVMLLAGLGLLAMQQWARWVAILAVLQIGTVTAFPIYSLIIIALDVVILYQLTARWQQAT